MIDGLIPLVEIALSAETWSTPLWLRLEGVLVAATRDGRVSAWRPSGERVWSREVGNVITASPNFARLRDGQSVVLIGAHDGGLSALDARDGRTRWQRALGGVIRASVSVAASEHSGAREPQVFAASYGDYLWSIDAASGEVRWRKWLPRHVWARSRGVVSSPIVADVDGDGRLEVVVGTRSWRLFCVDADSGSLRWWRGFDYGIDSTCTLALADGSPLLLLGTGESLHGPGDRAILALTGAEGTVRWRRRVGGGVDSSATCFQVDGRFKLVQSSLADASCHCLDLATGKLEWSYRMGPTEACTHDANNVCIRKGAPAYFTDNACCRSYTVPLVADIDGDGALEVLVGSMNGLIYALDASTGQEKGRWDAAAPVRGSPILADIDGDGRLELVVASARRLALFRTRAVGRDWPSFKGDQSLSGAPDASRSDAARVPTRGPRRKLTPESRLLFEWTLRDLGYFVRTRVDKHILNRFGRRCMSYWY
jgi:hypothetical protein